MHCASQSVRQHSKLLESIALLSKWYKSGRVHRFRATPVLMELTLQYCNLCYISQGLHPPLDSLWSPMNKGSPHVALNSPEIHQSSNQHPGIQRLFQGSFDTLPDVWAGGRQEGWSGLVSWPSQSSLTGLGGISGGTVSLIRSAVILIAARKSFLAEVSGEILDVREAPDNEELLSYS